MRAWLLVLVSLPLFVHAADPLLPRVERLERRADVLSRLLLKVQRLEREAQQQQGRIDALEYRLRQQDKRMRDLFQDLDRRLGEQRGMAPPVAASSPPADTPAASQPPAEQAAPSPPSPTALPPQPATAPPGDADAAYRRAFQFLRDRDYARAASAFRGFVERYPDAPLAENAWYWLGEAHYAQNQYPEAQRAFAHVIEKYPFGAKVPGALLKSGFIHAANGDRARARELLTRVVEEYPSSAVAPLARKKLSQLKR